MAEKLTDLLDRMDAGELQALCVLRQLGVTRGDLEVPDQLVPVLLERLNTRLGDPPIAGESDPSLVERIRQEPQPRSRLLRRLLHKLDKEGRWGPSALRAHSLIRGFSEDERGLVREVAEVLVRINWLVQPAGRRVRGESVYALNPDYHREIEHLVETGELQAPAALAHWLGASD